MSQLENEMPVAADYLTLLERWMKGAAPYLYSPPERPDLMCYGTGDNTWGVQTNQKAFAAFAMLAAAPEVDEKTTGMSHEQIKETALRLLRFSLQSHHVGDYRCTDGTTWGHTWISVLGLERMMHGVDAIDELLTEEDHDLLRKVLQSESDWLLDHYDVAAGLYAKDGNNRPESNLWNGALLHRTATMYPDSPRASQYKEKGNQFLINSISVPSDEDNTSIVDGKPVSERFIGANFFESMGLNHHGYLNVGYKVICLSNVAMLHFMYRRKGLQAPESLYHHVEELWKVVKSLIFPDGRLLRIGGDTRVRYTYCQEYLIPVWLMARDLYGDEDSAAMAKGWLEQISCEMDVNGDGTFLSARGESLAQQSPLYFTRLESDRAATLSMGAAWTDLVSYSAENTEALTSWHDAYHGAYYHRSEERVASWVWDAAEKPQGLCLDPKTSDMAEWRENLAGKISGNGKINGQRLISHGGRTLEGGFITWGSTISYTEGLLEEGKNEDDIARNQFVCAALPDRKSMVVLHYAQALDRRGFVQSVKGLQLLMPNDIFNENHRKYFYANGVLPIHGYGARKETIPLHSNWLNIDDQLGVMSLYGADSMYIHRPGRREIGLKQTLKHQEKEGTLYVDEICGPINMTPQSLDPNQVILDTGYMLQAGQHHTATKQYSDGDHIHVITGLGEFVRGVQIQGADGKRYVVLANFGDQDEQVDIDADANDIHVTLKAGEGKLINFRG